MYSDVLSRLTVDFKRFEFTGMCWFANFEPTKLSYLFHSIRLCVV